MPESSLRSAKAGLWPSVQGYWTLLCYGARNLRELKKGPVLRVFYQQLYFTGVEALKVVSVLALLCGVLVVTQTTALVGGNSELTVKVLIWLVVREVGPLFAAIIIAARSSTAIASELALMKINGEMTYLERMHISPLNYLVVPRLAGVTLSVLIMTVYFQLIAIGGGLAVSALFQDVSFIQQVERFFSLVRLSEFGVVLMKGFVFGVTIASVSCYHGLSANLAITGVPKAAISAVMRSLFLIFLIDALIAYLFFL
ncbi:MAG: ABC transporter permease [Gallionella sp.]|jgi:phospholipid/cholesterol/gamma-HCH transport system permease protein